MAHIRVEKTVALSSAQAFAIAADVASYKEFLPLVKRSSIRGAVTREDAVTKFSADLQIALNRMNINESFTSHVVADATQNTVTATSDQGPVKTLKCVWKIVGISAQQSIVSVEIDYQFKSMLLQLAAGGFMNVAVQRVLDAFETRGSVIYPTAV
jgi:coenzyme Q-binding protein COQ10